MSLLLFFLSVCGVAARRLYDAFTFNDEWDMLEIRIRTLESVVDVFVICESNVTFSGRPKPLRLTENTEFLAEYRHKMRIVYPVLVSGNLADRQPWNNEYASRDALVAGLGDATPDDWVVVSDVDEIPRPHALQQLWHRTELSVGFPCFFHYYSYRQRADVLFGMPVAHRIGTMRKGVSQFAWKQAAHLFPGGSCWHCSYCFGPDDDGFVRTVISKLTSFAHIEYSGGKYIEREYILSRRNNSLSLFSDDRFNVLSEVDAPPVVLHDKRFHYLLGNEFAPTD
jgi:hypothetical protein